MLTWKDFWSHSNFFTGDTRTPAGPHSGSRTTCKCRPMALVRLCVIGMCYCITRDHCLGSHVMRRSGEVRISVYMPAQLKEGAEVYAINEIPTSYSFVYRAIKCGYLAQRQSHVGLFLCGIGWRTNEYEVGISYLLTGQYRLIHRSGAAVRECTVLPKATCNSTFISCHG